MNLGLFLSVSDSLEKQTQTGQLERLSKYYLKPYSKKFNNIYLFSYGDSGQKFILPAKVIHIPKPKYIPNYLYQLILPFIHFKIIKKIDVNRVFQTPGGLPAIICKIFFRKPYITTYGYDYIRFTKIEHQPVLTKLFSLVIPLVIRFADKIIITFKNSLNNPKAVIIHNGIDPRVFKPGKKPKEKYLVLSVGRLVHQKNYKQLIKVISLSKYKNKIKLVIIGIGPLQKQLLNFSKTLKVNLTIIPNVRHSQLVGWYQKANVFSLTSIIEGQVKVLLEALSTGCACLTTPFIGNMTKDNATGLIGENLNQLTHKLDQLLSDSDLNQTLGRQGRQMIIRDFDLKKLVQKEIKLLKSINK